MAPGHTASTDGRDASYEPPPRQSQRTKRRRVSTADEGENRHTSRDTSMEETADRCQDDEAMDLQPQKRHRNSENMHRQPTPLTAVSQGEDNVDDNRQESHSDCVVAPVVGQCYIGYVSESSRKWQALVVFPDGDLASLGLSGHLRDTGLLKRPPEGTYTSFGSEIVNWKPAYHAGGPKELQRRVPVLLLRHLGNAILFKGDSMRPCVSPGPGRQYFKWLELKRIRPYAEIYDGCPVQNIDEAKTWTESLRRMERNPEGWSERQESGGEY